MPYVEGESLRARLERERQLPIEEAVRIAHEAARALDHAHRHGIIHRDIKPENILLTADGDTLVADFGVGKALSGTEEGDRLTETGVVVGTPAYMSPEQVAGERNLDGRTDVYSLGTVLYEMLAGEPPFTGATAHAIVARRLAEAPRPIRPARDSVPPELERVVLRSLARAPADRYTAAAFADAMDVARHAPAASPASQQDTGEVKAPRAHRRWWIGALVAALLAALAAAWLLHYFDRVVLAQLLVDAGRDAEAWHLLQADLPSATVVPSPTEVVWSLLRGRAAERVGERDRAIRAYSWVVGMWRRPDPELEPYVVEAREGLARLTGEKR